jgi:hypothetical protein
MTDAQRAALRRVLADRGTTILHHGDCVGADAEAHDLAVSIGCEVVIHPPILASKRAWKHAEPTLKPKAYLSRNKDIVQDTEMLVAAPAEETEQIRSGTWSTVRFARKLDRTVWVILPNGDVYK